MTTTTTTKTTSGFDWKSLASDIALVGSAIESLFPTAATAISVATKIVQGVVDAIPTAVALYDQIKSGTPPTADQLTSYQSDYEAAYKTLDADIAAALAKAS